MKYSVNEKCIACGLCTEICPEVFEIGGDGMAAAKQQPVSREAEAAAEEALESCPVNAIIRQ